MAAAATFSAGKLLFLVGDGGGSEVFAEPCAVLQAEMNINKDLAETLIPDCSDPDLVGWINRDAQSLSMTLSLTGVATSTAVATLSTLALANSSRNCRIQLVGAGSGGGTPDFRWSGAFHASNFQLGRQRAEKISFSVELMSDGDITAASVAALS